MCIVVGYALNDLNEISTSKLHSKLITSIPRSMFKNIYKVSITLIVFKRLHQFWNNLDTKTVHLCIFFFLFLFSLTFLLTINRGSLEVFLRTYEWERKPKPRLMRNRWFVLLIEWSFKISSWLFKLTSRFIPTHMYIWS